MSTQATHEAMAGASRVLLESWDQFLNRPGDSITFGTRERRPSAGRFATVWALAAHSHRLASTALATLESNPGVEAGPSVRAAWEHAVQAIWVAQLDHAHWAVSQRRTKHIRDLDNTLLKSRDKDLRTQAEAHLVELEQATSQESGSWVSPHSVQLGNFEALCEDLEPGGADLYWLYRALCQTTHPSVYALDGYISGDADTWGVQPEPEVGRFESMRAFHVLRILEALIWAGQAVDYMDRDGNTWRNILRSTADEFDIERHLRPTHAAKKRDVAPPARPNPAAVEARARELFGVAKIG